jgi:sigma-B regulation protein RsbU (phosphoserine phosphatase)
MGVAKQVSKKAPSTLLGLRALVEASDDGIIGKTVDGTIVSWNKGAEKIYGYQAEEIVGQPISVLIPPGHPNEFPEIMMRLRRGEHIEKYETTRIHKDGHTIDVSVTISPVTTRGGMVVGASVVARDITEQKETIVKLQRALDEIQVLRGLLSICANCKRIKDEHERWQVLEVYIQAHSGAKFSHGICPECMRKLYPEYCPQ